MSLFFQNKTRYKAQSVSAIAWRKFCKNKQGMTFLVFIGILSVIAVLGYAITPDSTPYANEQILEIRLLKPMSKVKMVPVKKNYDVPHYHFIRKMLFGQPDDCTPIAISNYTVKHDSLIVYRLHESAPYDREVYHLADVIYALDEQSPVVTDGQTCTFTTVHHEKISQTVTQLQQAAIKRIHTKTYILGTDRYGRDVLSQLIIGARVSLSVGFVSVFIALIIGIFLGAVAGFYKGKVDDFIMWFINVVWSIPTLLLVIAISFALGTGFWQIFIAIGLTMWVDIARVVRGQVISLREKEYVEASKAMGFKNISIIFKHILPNITGTIIVVAAANFASAILTEASLSFLGIGVQAPMPSWGTMIKENYGYIILDYAYLAIVPGIAIMLLVLCFMLLGNVLRDVLDVKDNG